MKKIPKTWNELSVKVHKEVLNGIRSLNFPSMTPVQAHTIPQLLNKKDVAVEAVTGKTVFKQKEKLPCQRH